MVKDLFISLLQTEILGRASRKFFHILTRLSYLLYSLCTRINSVLPYLVKSAEEEQFEKSKKYCETLGGYVNNLPSKPLISILIPVYKTDLTHLRECLESCSNQIYDNWEICLVDDNSNDQEISSLVSEYKKTYPNKFQCSYNEKNLHISETLNNCLKLAKGEFITIVDHDDRIYPNSLAEFVRYHNLYSEVDIFYSDERIIDEQGENLGLPFFKPHWSPYFHLRVNYTTHLSFYRTSLARKIKGFRRGLEGSQDHDFMLRAVEESSQVIHIPFCLYQWRAHPKSTASSISAKPYAAIAGEEAVKQFLARKEIEAQVSFDESTLHYRIKYRINQPNPLVSIIIPNKNYCETLKQCLESIYKLSSYKNFEVIISDNGTTEKRTLQLYEDYQKNVPKFRVLRNFFDFNFGKQINFGAEIAEGKFLLLLNNDTQVITPSWIEEMLQLAQFPDVGAVGCKLLYPQDRTIQHAGIALSSEQIAEHEGVGSKETDRVYCDMLNTVREVEAVTAACMMISQENFKKVKGFNSQFLPNVYGDVEFCIKLNSLGLSNIFTPHAILKHYESKSRKAFPEEFERFYMRKKYGKKLSWDSYHNPRLLPRGGKDHDPFYLQLDYNNSTRKKLLKSLSTSNQ